MKYRIVDALWLTLSIALALVCAVQRNDNRLLKEKLADIESARGKLLLELAGEGIRIPLALLKQPFDCSLRFGGGMTLGPLVICNGDFDAAKFLIDAGIDLRTKHNRNDGIEAAFFANSPQALKMVLLSCQWKPSEVSGYLDLADDHRFTALGEGSQRKNEEYAQNKVMMKQILIDFANNGTVDGETPKQRQDKE